MDQQPQNDPNPVYQVPPTMSQQELANKNWFAAHWILGVVFLLAVGGVAVAGIYYWQTVRDIPASFQTPVHKEKVDETAAWETYVNNQFGFKYPKDWILKDGNEVDPNRLFNTAEITKNISDSDYLRLSFTASKENLQGSQTGPQTTLKGASWTNVEFNDGVPGQSAPRDSLAMFTKQDDTYYQINIYPATAKAYDNKINIDPLLNQIISTFEFGQTQLPTLVCDPKNAPAVSVSTSTQGWSTYNSSDFGFEVSFPKDWTLDVKKPSDLSNVANNITLNSPQTQNICKQIESGKVWGEGYAEDILVNVYPISQIKSLDEYIAKNTDVDKTTIKRISLAGANGYEMTIGGFSANYSVLLQKGIFAYEIFFGNTDKKSELTQDESKILSSFKFTK